MPRLESFEFLLENRDFFGLFQNYRQQGELKGQQRFGLPNGSDVAARGGKEAIEDVLVAAAQGASKGGQRGLDLIQVLRNGGGGAAHGK